MRPTPIKVDERASSSCTPPHAACRKAVPFGRSSALVVRDFGDISTSPGSFVTAAYMHHRSVCRVCASFLRPGSGRWLTISAPQPSLRTCRGLVLLIVMHVPSTSMVSRQYPYKPLSTPDIYSARHQFFLLRLRPIPYTLLVLARPRGRRRPSRGFSSECLLALRLRCFRWD